MAPHSTKAASFALEMNANEFHADRTFYWAVLLIDVGTCAETQYRALIDTQRALFVVQDTVKI